MLVEGAARHNPEPAVCIVLAADTGARRGELCALRWSKSSTTSNIYSHWIAETDQRAAVVIGERIWGQPNQVER